MMTFKQMTYKIFKTNFRRYLLYFLCSSFTVLMFFVYSTLYTNKKLMNSPQIGSNIASMFIAPNIGLIIFSVFLIIYSHNSFNKFRRKEFGMFMVLGMTKTEIRKIIVFENSLIGFLSIMTGLALGTIFSRLFYYITFKIIDVNDIPYELSLKSYLSTILLFTAIYIVVILISVITSLKYEIINLLKESRKEDRSLINKPIFGLFGIFLIIASFADIILNYKNDKSYVLFRSFLFCIIGIYFFISSIAWLISMIKSITKRKYYKNVIFVTNLKHTFGQSKKIIFLITLLVAITVFFSSISITITSDSQRLAKGYNPYDIAYVKLLGKNNIPEKDLNKILTDEKNKLTSDKSVEFIYAQRQILLSDKILNEVLGCNFHVEKGNYTSLFQIIKDDGYAYDTNVISSINLEATSGKKQYYSKESLVQVLFNRFPMFQDGHYLIFNNDDYLDIKGKINSNQLGYIKLMNFKDWSETKDIYSNLKADTDKYNKENTKPYFGTPAVDSYMFQPVSRIDDYIKRRDAGEFSLFLFSFTGILFLVASAALLHFKLQTEYEREKIKYKKLHKIGITAKEVKNMISKEFRVLFFLPYIFGILLASFYSYSLPVQQGKGGASAMYSLIIGIVYLIFQILYYLFYKVMYIRRLFRDLNR